MNNDDNKAAENTEMSGSNNNAPKAHMTKKASTKSPAVAETPPIFGKRTLSPTNATKVKTTLMISVLISDTPK